MIAPPRIAVAQNDWNTRELLQELLSRLGHQVTTAETGRQLIELCRTFPPDLIITDVVMPEIDGIEAVQTICRERPVPIILLAEGYSADLLARVASTPALSFLLKPVHKVALQVAIAVAMARSRGYQDSDPDAPAGR